MPDSPRPPRRSVDPVVAMVAGWAIPGAGHLLIGQVKKGLFFFVVLILTFVAGLFLADFRTVRASDNPFYFVGQVGSGLNLLLTYLCTNLHPRGWMPQVYFEPGLLYMSVSGLLNILVIMAILPPVEVKAGERKGSGAVSPEDKGVEEGAAKAD